MKQTEKMDVLRRKYISPRSKVFNIRAHGPLCTSGEVRTNRWSYEEEGEEV